MKKIPALEIVSSEPGGRLEARAWDATDLIVLQLEGVAELPDRPQLSELLKRVHAEAMFRAVKTVVVDIWKLKFMASSCFKDFVSWISLVQELDPRYFIRFKINPAIRWQKGSMHTLVTFGVDIVSIEQGVAP